MKKTLFKKVAVVILLFAGYSVVSAQGDAELELKSVATEAFKDQQFSVDIKLNNPGLQNIISVQSWLSYDVSVLEAVAINTNLSPFGLAAPGENNISSSEGRVKIGRANIAGGVSDAEAIVATVAFRVLADRALTTTIDFYDYQVTELGHTTVMIMDGGFPLNILSKKPEAFQISLNPGALPAEPQAPVFTPQAPAIIPQSIGGGSVFSSNLIRPTNLKVNTGSGYVDLRWDFVSDPARIGYNVYYGKVSGIYTRRRSIGNVNQFRLDGLTNNDTYYFAITAYDQFNQESDYSQEVGVIINRPLSSTSPFEGLISQALSRLPAQPQNGPLVGWLAFSAIGLGATIVFRPKKRKVTI